MINADFDIKNIKLIAGLGNIGDKYTNTRHNAGFLFLDELTNSEFKEESKFKSLLSQTEKFDISQVLLKPTTMMNNSGLALYEYKNFYKLRNKEILLIFDDLDIPFGTYKIQRSKGPQVHNGVNSVEKYLKKDFWRLRIGVENRSDSQRKKMSGQAYLLANFTEEEKIELKKVYKNIIHKLKGDI